MKKLIMGLALLSAAAAFGGGRTCTLDATSYYPFNPGERYETYGLFGSLFDGETESIQVMSEKTVIVKFHGGEYWDASRVEFSCRPHLKRQLCRSTENEKDLFLLEEDGSGFKAYSKKNEILVRFECK